MEGFEQFSYGTSQSRKKKKMISKSLKRLSSCGHKELNHRLIQMKIKGYKIELELTK